MGANVFTSCASKLSNVTNVYLALKGETQCHTLNGTFTTVFFCNI